MLLAKPVVNKKYWILKKDDQKVGNIQATDTGYQITIANKVTSYKTIPMLCRREHVEFEKPARSARPPANLVHGFAVEGRVYNALWDVKNQLPLYTKSSKSKSWFAAGWYRICQHRRWETVRDPKLIALQRYRYQGPFHSAAEAESADHGVVA